VPHVITSSCLDVMDKSCIEECPVDCIYEGDRMMYIQPDECGRCEPVCPQISIFPHEDLPDPIKHFERINFEFFVQLGSPVEQLHASSVRLLTPYEVHKMSGDPTIDEVVVTNRSGDMQALPAQAVVAALGFIADLGPIEGWGLELRHRHILVDRTMRTNLARVFAAGDIADYDGKVELISIGLGEAALAVNHIAALAHPGTSVVPGHSSDL
jgi:NAD-dependent dihydropyrimidine dehydrogenase PreA subunit